MAQMSEKFRQLGSEVYVAADAVKGRQRGVVAPLLIWRSSDTDRNPNDRANAFSRGPQGPRARSRKLHKTEHMLLILKSGPNWDRTKGGSQFEGAGRPLRSGQTTDKIAAELADESGVPQDRHAANRERPF